MFFGEDLSSLAFVVMVSIAVGGAAIALLYPMFSNDKGSRRVKAIATGKKAESSGNTWRSRFTEDSKDTRRRQIQDSLKQVGKQEKELKKKRASLRVSLEQAGLEISVRAYWVSACILGFGMGVIAFIIYPNPIVVAMVVFVGVMGLPRWILKTLRKRRQNIFLNDFADALDVMVRGLKSGLPVTEAMKIIASESGPPVGPEFAEVVEGQRLGISIEQGIERMVDRIPLPEVNFLAIVMAIQSKTGGNLSEALGNLSRVLRDRKKMKQKVTSVSQEAKSSAAIIGSLPFILMISLTMLNPTYLSPLFNTQMGHILLIGSGIWMSTGVLVMRKMINFQI
ncbi:MAG: type II secretion system F family protein [Alphaproteobacteria bacterium]|nr:type II secretion system F family protein [Alphaproteobacteria bacterium]